MRMFGAIAMALLVAAPSLAQAAEATPPKGDLWSDPAGRERMCASFFHQLKALPPQTPMNRWSEQLSYPGLKRPDWSPVDPAAHTDLIIKAFAYAHVPPPAGLADPVDPAVAASVAPQVKALIATNQVRVERAKAPSEFGDLDLYRIERFEVGYGSVGAPKYDPKNKAPYWIYVVGSVGDNPSVRDWPVNTYSLGFDVFNVGGHLYWVELPFGPIHSIDFTAGAPVPSFGTACAILMPAEKSGAVHYRKLH